MLTQAHRLDTMAETLLAYGYVFLSYLISFIICWWVLGENIKWTLIISPFLTPFIFFPILYWNNTS